MSFRAIFHMVMVICMSGFFVARSSLIRGISSLATVAYKSTASYFSSRDCRSLSIESLIE